MSRLRTELANNPKVGEIRGIGMELGIDIVKDRSSKEKDAEAVEKIVQGAYKRELHIVCDHASTIQLMPPLIIERKNLDEGLARLIECVNALVV